MEESLSFHDYLMGDGHVSFKSGADVRMCTRRKVVLMKDIRGLGTGLGTRPMPGSRISLLQCRFQDLRRISLMQSSGTWLWKECLLTWD